MKSKNRSISLMLSLAILSSAVIPVNASTDMGDTSYSSMLSRAEALVNYEWVPSERIYTWNGNEYNGKDYFEAGETVKGVPYTLFSWELGFDGLLSLEQYRQKASVNYSTTAYCTSVSDQRIGPAFGNCCATLVSEVFGGSFMNGSDPKYDGVGTVRNSTYSTTYTNVKATAIQPGDALSCTSGAHIVWVGAVDSDFITIYESTPPVCQKVVLDLASHTDSNGYLVYNDNTYNIVTKSNEIVRDDLSTVATLSDGTPMPLHAYTLVDEKTVVYDSIGGAVKSNKIYGTDLCFIDAVFDNGWCHVNFPLDAGGLDHGYVKTSVFFDSDSITVDSGKTSVPVYTRSDLSKSFGRTPSGNDLYFVNETSTAFQVIYSITSGGYNLGWVSKADLENASAEAFFDQFCPIKGYPCVTENFEVKQSDYSTRGGEIYTTDYCTINEVYSDGWCQVTFPLDAGGERTAYTPISNFVYDTDYPISSYVTEKQINVYTKKDLATYQNWWTGAGDTVYIVGEHGDALQICYPIDAAYGGGYKLGWIPRSAISVEQEKVLDSISVNSNPIKTEYTVGEEFDPAGFELLLIYSDGSTEIITGGFEVSGFDSTVTGTKNVAVTYEGKTAYTTVCVKPAAVFVPAYHMTAAKGIAGATVEVVVAITDNPGIISLRNRISYDASALELMGVTDTGLLKGYNVPSSAMNSPYTLRWADSLATDNNVSNGDVVKLTFRIKETAAAGSYDISVVPVESRNVDGTKVTFEGISSAITVIDYIPGDVDGDGEVSDWDAITLNRYLAGWDVEISKYAADADSDGEVSDWDAIILDRYLAGWNIELGN